MPHPSTSWAVLFAFLTAGPAAAADTAAEARTAFNNLYGSKVREVTATADKCDDAVLAQQMVDAAKLAQSTPGLMTLLCEQAFQLGLRDRAGYPAALAAMQTLAEQRPETKLDAMQKIVQLRQIDFNSSKPADRPAVGSELIAAMIALAEARSQKSQYVASLEDLRKALVVARQINSNDAEPLKERVRLANHQAQLARQVDSLRTRLLRDRTDSAAAEELVTLFVRELNEPAKAAEYVPLLLPSSSLHKHVTLSSKSIETLNDAELLSLAQWYREQAEQASPSGKPPLLTRSMDYFRGYLAQHTAEDLDRAQAAVQLKQVEDALAASGSGSGAVGSDAPASPAAAAKNDGLTTVGAKPRKTLHEDPKMVSAVAVDAAGKFAATSSQPEGSVRLFDLEKGAQAAVLNDDKKWLSSVAIAPRGDVVAACDLHHEVHLWSTKTGKLIATLKKHTGHLYVVAISPDGEEVASGGADRAIHLWDAAGAKWKKQLSGHGNTIRTLAYSPAGDSAATRLLASGGDDGEVRLWRGGQDEPAVLKGHSAAVHAVVFSTDGRHLASADAAGNVLIWDVAKSQVLHKLTLGATARTVAFSPDGTALFAAGDGKLIRLWHVPTGKPMADLTGHTDIVTRLAFTPDGRTLLSASNDRSVRLWDVVRQRGAPASTQTSQK